MADRLLRRPDVEVWHADWKSLLAELPRREDNTVCDSLIVDCPYSERTHAGHDGGDRFDGSCVEHGDPAYGHRQRTRGINYAPWSAGDVRAFVDAWSPLTVGWMVSITDDVLAQEWRAAWEAIGRYAFAPLPLVEIGSRVRLVGDGPSSWTCQIVVSRPRDGAWLASWREQRRQLGLPRALPGAYIYTGKGDRGVMGGKASAAMRALVRDYTRPGDLVCDPCCGAGTTLLAAVMEGRRAVGGDVLEAHAQLAAARLDRPVQTPLFGGSL